MTDSDVVVLLSFFELTFLEIMVRATLFIITRESGAGQLSYWRLRQY